MSVATVPVFFLSPSHCNGEPRKERDVLPVSFGISLGLQSLLQKDCSVFISVAEGKNLPHKPFSILCEGIMFIPVSGVIDLPLPE